MSFLRATSIRISFSFSQSIFPYSIVFIFTIRIHLPFAYQTSCLTKLDSVAKLLISCVNSKKAAIFSHTYAKRQGFGNKKISDRLKEIDSTLAHLRNSDPEGNSSRIRELEESFSYYCDKFDEVERTV